MFFGFLKSPIAICAMLLLFLLQQANAQDQCIDGSTTVCSKNQYTYRVLNPPASTASIQWSASNGTPSGQTGNTTSVTWSNPGTGAVTAVFYRSNGAIISSCRLTTDIQPLPNASMTPSVPPQACYTENGSHPNVLGYCEGLEVAFSAAGGGSYQWSASGGAQIVLPDNQQTAIVKFAGSGNSKVCVTVTSDNGCTSEVCSTYVVYPRPIADFSVLSHPNAAWQIEICRGESLTFLGSYSEPNNLPILSYNWSTIQSGGGSIGSANTLNYTQVFAQPGTYEVYFLVTNCMGCTGERKLIVHVNEYEGTEITCASVACEGESAIYCGPDNCSTFNWTVSGNISQRAVPNQPNCIEVKWGMPSSGYGTVTLSCPNALCPLPTTVEIPIIPKHPKIEGPVLICDNNQSDITYSLPYWPGTTYNWTVSNGASGSSLPQSPNIFVVNLLNFGGPSFEVCASVRNIIADCQSSGCLNVNVRDYSIETTPNGPICFNFSNGSPTFTVVPTPSPSGYQVKWVIKNQKFSSGAIWGAPNSPTLSGLDFQTAFGGLSGDFEVAAEIVYGLTGQTCDGLKTNVTILPEVPRVLDITGNKSVCLGRTETYRAIPSVNGSSYQWQVLSGGVIVGPDNLETVQVTWNAMGSHVLRVRRALYGCFSEWYEITVSLTPLLSINITGEDLVCPGEAYSYSTTEVLDKYEWTANGGNIISGQNTKEVVVIWDQYNNPLYPYQIKLKGTRCGQSVTTFMSITLKDLQAAITGPSSICQYSTGTYAVAPADPGATYSWFVDDIPLNVPEPSVRLQFPNIGSATIRVRIDNYMGCSSVIGIEYPINITANPLPIITQSGFLVCAEAGEVTLLASRSSSNTAGNYQWYHIENGSPVALKDSPFKALYNAVGPVLTIKYDPDYPEAIGVFSVLLDNGPNCLSEASYEVKCSIVNNGTCGEVSFEHWEYIEECGEILAKGFISQECYVENTAAIGVLGGDGYTGLNPVYISDINNPSAELSPFTKPGVYQVAITADYDCYPDDDIEAKHCMAVKSVPIPVITGFVKRVTCIQGSTGMYRIDLLNTSEYLPEFDGKIRWTWSVDGIDISNDRNTSFTIIAGTAVDICLSAEVDYDDKVEEAYICSDCDYVSVPGILEIDISYLPNITCVGSAIKFSPILPVGSQAIQFNWQQIHQSGAGNTVVYSSSEEPTFVFSNTGNYTVSLEVVFANGCRATVTKSLVIEQPTIPFSQIRETNEPCGAKMLTICDADCSAYTYLWNTTPPQSTPSILATVSGTYRVTVTDIVHGCTQEFIKNTTARSPFPNGYFGNLAQCSGDNLLLLSVPVVTGFKYTYNGIGPSPQTYMGSQIWNIDLGNKVNLMPGNYPFVVTAKDLATGEDCGAVLTGTFVVYEKPSVFPFTVMYSCDPFKAELTASTIVDWYKNGSYITHATSITVYEEAEYWSKVTNDQGCSAIYKRNVQGPLEINILEGCYCIEPEVVDAGEAIVSAPSGIFSYWEWRHDNPSITLPKCQTSPDCNIIPDLVLDPSMVGKIRLYVERAYKNSDGSTVTCSDLSGEFCWELGPCEPCTPPVPTTRTIACLDSTKSGRLYHIHWDFVDDKNTHPCGYTQNQPVKVGNTEVGHFESINENWINGYWHFEGIFNLDMPVDPFTVCWEIPFCRDGSNQPCGVSNVCPRTSNPQHKDDVVRRCTDKNLPYCDNLNANANIVCNNNPNTPGTHIINLALTAIVDADAATIRCPNFSFYITSVTGTFPVPGNLVRLDVNAPAVNGRHIITATVAIPWDDNIGIDDVCMQIILAHRDACWPSLGNLCHRRFCFDASGLPCRFTGTPYRFSAQCIQVGDAGPEYKYTVIFPNETNITKCSVANSNPNGKNTIDSYSGNVVTGLYISYSGSLQFDDVFTINNQNIYNVSGFLPNCNEGGGSDGQDGTGPRGQWGAPAHDVASSLKITPNPSSGNVLLDYRLPGEPSDAQGKIAIFDVLGILQEEIVLKAGERSGFVTYDATALKNGVYQVCLIDKGRSISTMRLVVMK